MCGFIHCQIKLCILLKPLITQSHVRHRAGNAGTHRRLRLLPRGSWLVQAWLQQFGFFGIHETDEDDSFVVKLGPSVRANILRREVEIDSKTGKFVDSHSLFELNILRVKLKSNLEIDATCVHDSLRREVETAGSETEKLFVDNQSSLRCEVELVLSWVQYPSLGTISSIVKLKSWMCGYDILRRGVEIADGPFVVRLSLDLNILRREVETQISFVVKLKSTLEPNCVVSRETVSRETKLSSKRNGLKGDKTEFQKKLSQGRRNLFQGKIFVSRFDGVACMLLYWKCSLTPNLHSHTQIVRCRTKELVRSSQLHNFYIRAAFSGFQLEP
ncbi:hypothetical protein F3Y22_tig00113279pilonHSYRG00001 [Hibiscus syriacus]|uniref:Uncharacterized protein n=1 Tax=Hibiscus syriacus TaxID=106335 RepID=A0A6A2WQ32_HIBSY|nr:hypothetical protein F3Y22_tig00113279pilonHSYRG00001 [Hibiscus syriacus]